MVTSIDDLVPSSQTKVERWNCSYRSSLVSLISHHLSYWTLKPNSKVGLFPSSFCHQHVRENLPKCSLQRDCFILAKLSPTVWCPLQMCWVLRSKKPVQPRTSSCNPCLSSLSTLATPFENSDEQQILRFSYLFVFRVRDWPRFS